ncbi:unnamed protein product [Lactuca saligna]|uniref:3-oxoacyl-[acyl-carrier-protein] reductase n=1 Tax=Lactuca saligna TaxID=75948 RepID=A0AA36E913_LACSI|nr:unnamed protein product [Lactuca saligna]
MASSCDQFEAWRDLRGKVVMVTGASSGLGRDFSIDLAKAGCKIIAAARRTDLLKSLCDEINNMELNLISDDHIDDDVHEANQGQIAVAIELDICADGPTIEASVQKAWETFGRIDVLINNAGIRGNLSLVLSKMNFTM